MIITCQNCKSSYQLDETLLAPGGSKVRCSNCGNLFVAYPSPPAQVAEPAPAEEAPQATDEKAMPDADDSRDETGGTQEFGSELDLDPDVDDSGALFEENAAPDSDWQRTAEAETDPDPEFAQDLDLDLDLDLDIEEGPALEEMPDADESGQDLDLDLDLDVEEGPALEEMPDVDESGQDLDLDLDLYLEEEPVLDEAPDAGESGQDLDLDLDLYLEEEPVLDEAPDADESGQDLELDLDLEFEEGLVLEEAPQAGPSGQGLDLDLDLDIEKGPAFLEMPDEDESDSDKDLGLDLNLDLEEDPTLEEPVAAAAEDRTGDGIEVEPGENGAPGEELDLTELEKALDIAMPQRDEELEALDLDFNLDLEMDDQDAEAESHKTADEALGVDEELDLSEIEEMLQADEGFDEDEPDPDSTTKSSTQKETTQEEDLDLVSTQDLGQVTALFEEIQAETLVDDQTFDGQATLRFGKLGEPGEGQEAEMAAGSVPPEPKIKRGPSPLLVLLLILLLLGGGVYGAHLMGVRIPFVSDMLAPQVIKDELGNLKISTSDINSRFVDNSQAGRLFVITGKVRNDYPQPHSFIQVQGKIFQKGKKMVATETVSCGNVLADLDLAHLPLAQIQKRLDNRTGANKSNLNVPPGGVIPFMVVFHNLPADLDEFTIEVARSQ